MEETLAGLVIRSTGSRYVVRTAEGSCYDCTLKGRIRTQGLRSTNPVAVGDRVRFTPGPLPQSGVIDDVEDRKNYIIRKSTNLSKETHILAANLDQVFLVVTLRFPEIKLAFIDRYLAAAEAYRVPVCIVFHKMDLYTAAETEEIRRLQDVYQKIGYRVLLTSIPGRQQLEELKEMTRGRISLFSGNSGVGKSSLVNWIQPGFNLRTAAVSEATRSGRHTTTFAEMVPLDHGGYIIDTPGIRGFGLVHVNKEEVYHFFPEIFRVASKCQYHNCLHINEPHCAVKEAVQAGEIAESRYLSYLGILAGDEKYR